MLKDFKIFRLKFFEVQFLYFCFSFLYTFIFALKVLNCFYRLFFVQILLFLYRLIFYFLKNTIKIFGVFTHCTIFLLFFFGFFLLFALFYLKVFPNVIKSIWTNYIFLLDNSRKVTYFLTFVYQFSLAVILFF